MVCQFSEEKKNTISPLVTLCNIHHRLFFRPYSMSTGSGFFFWLLLIAAKDWNFKNLTPFQNLDSLQAANLPETVGKTLQRGRSSCWTVHAAKCTKEWHWVHNNAHFLSATATPNRDWIYYSGIGWFWVSGTIPNKVSPNAVDLRVFLVFGTVQTEETKTFINSKGFIIALMKSKSLQLQSNKSKKEHHKHWKQKQKYCSFMYYIYSLEMCLALFLW